MSNVLPFKLDQSIYYAWCEECKICISWGGQANQNGWGQCPSWLFQALTEHHKNCTGSFLCKEEKV